jgi:hypothetical protein
MAEWRETPHHEAPQSAYVWGQGHTSDVLWFDQADGPPTNDDAPHVSQTGSTLSCTMGNWHDYPTSYAYQWQVDGADVGTNSPTHSVTPDDVGKFASCTVTATNSYGSTEAPRSNSVLIT